MAKTNQQILAHLQELVQLSLLFLAIVSKYHYDPGPPQQHDNLKHPTTTLTLANSQIQLWTTVARFLPLSIVAMASIHATNHVMKASMAYSQHEPPPPCTTSHSTIWPGLAISLPALTWPNTRPKTCFVSQWNMSASKHLPFAIQDQGCSGPRRTCTP